jgi:amidase
MLSHFKFQATRMSAASSAPDHPEFDRRSALELIGGTVAAGLVNLPASASAAPKISEIVMMNAHDLAGAITSKKVSCVEVMNAYLDHIAIYNPKVNAIVALQDRDSLIAQAKERDAQLARGQIMGPLHGFPHAVKDLQPVKGIVSTSGSLILKDNIPTRDSLTVGRMRSAGAIFIGKTNAPEFGLGSHTYNRVYGATHNAYDQTRSAGGSSGGAGVSLALRMVPVADGSDYGGSLRNPAGWNNVFGFRTGFGVVPSGGFLPSLSVTGAMARTTSDVARLLSVLAGYDASAPLSTPGDGSHFLAPLESNVKGKRIAWTGDMKGFLPFEPGVLDVCKNALKTFESLGCTVDEAIPDAPLEPVWQAFMRLRHWQEGGGLAGYYADPAKRALMKPEAIWEVEGSLNLSASDISAASGVRSNWYAAMNRLFEHYDYLVMPTAQLFPFDVNQTWPHEIDGHTMQTYHEWMKGVCMITMAGYPSLAVPAGFSTAGLPMGLQIIAPINHEMDCLRMGYAYEKANDLTKIHLPPLLRSA